MVTDTSSIVRLPRGRPEEDEKIKELKGLAVMLNTIRPLSGAAAAGPDDVAAEDVL